MNRLYFPILLLIILQLKSIQRTEGLSFLSEISSECLLYETTMSHNEYNAPDLEKEHQQIHKMVKESLDIFTLTQILMKRITVENSLCFFTIEK